jgi:chaperonin GroEL (HSP60 family)
MIKEMVDSLTKVGAKVVICQKGIDDLAQHFLAQAGILAVRRVKKSDLEKLAKATGAHIVSRIKSISEKDLGFAEKVYEKSVGGEAMVFITGCKNPKAVSILVRGGTEQIVDEAERAVVDAVGSVASAIKSGKVVYGGGAAETEVAMYLRDYAKEMGGREQLAIEAFANALEVIPKTLAETAGLNPLDIIVALRNKHKEKNTFYGVNVLEGKIDDMKKVNVIEPVSIKIQAMNSASEVTQMILRIDDVIAGTSKGNANGPGGAPGMMPPGY